MPGNGAGLELNEKVPRRLRSEGQNRDVFCMVKATMSDDHLSQPPTLVFPHKFLPVTENFFRRINGTSHLLSASLEEGRCEELINLATNIEADFPHLKRGALYLRSLADQNRHIEPCKPFRFIEAGPSAFGLGDVQLGQRPPPPKPYKLMVKFHHLPPE